MLVLDRAPGASADLRRLRDRGHQVKTQATPTVWVSPYRRYPDFMRRPEVELSDAAARYVEEHPGVIEKLAGGIPDGSRPALTAEQKAHLRNRLHEARAYAGSIEGRTEADAFLVKVGLRR